MQIGIIGLPNVGKSTLFNALTQAQVDVSNYPFCTINPNIGIIEVPETRLAKIGELVPHQEIIPTTIKFLDIAGLVKGANRGEGLGNQFLAQIREVDALVEVVRCFEDVEVSHINETIEPLRDIEVIKTELILSDLETVERRLSKMKRSKDKEEFNLLLKIKQGLERGESATVRLGEQAADFAPSYLLTSKNILYLANAGEDDIPHFESKYIQQVENYAEKEQEESLAICAKLEAEITKLEKGERGEFLQAMGLKKSGLEKLIKVSYKLLNLLTFFTVEKGKIKAWALKKGTKALQAAGEIHTDMERGFICAEVVKYEDLVKVSSISSAQEQGLMSVEGKEYIVQEGDVVRFKFNI